MSHPTIMAGPTPVRPDAVRAYSGGGTQKGERKVTNNTLLLQQAASYAPLAQVSGSSSVYGAENVPSTSYLPFENAKSIRREDFADHTNLRSSLTGGVQSSTGRDSSSAVNDDYGYEMRHSAWSMAPRLSMSSAESSGGSEVKTPESINAQPSWREEGPVTHDSNDEVDARVQRTVGSSSPALLDMSAVTREPDGLAASGFPKAEDVRRTSVNPTLIQAATSIDEEDVETEESRDSIRRSVTIRAKRPDSLLKLPSVSYQTDRTITPSTSEPTPLRQDASPSSLEGSAAHAFDQGYGKQQAGSSMGGSESSSDRFESPESDGGDVYRFPSVHDERHSSWNSLQASHRANATAPLSPPERCAASPDSWRSLLPEHDPYYVRSEELVDRGSRAGSDARAPSHSLASIKQAVEDARDGRGGSRRWSDNSRKSTFSLPGPVAVPAAEGSWSTCSSLYDLDGTFNSSGSRAAFAPLQYGRNESSRSLAAPSVSTPMAGASENLQRGAMGKIADMVTEQQKRHSSFSTFDSRNAQNRAALHHGPFVHPDYLDDRSASARRTTGRASHETGATTVPPQPTHVKGTSVAQTNDSRENWPSSRNSLQPLPSPSMPEHAFAQSLKPERAEADGSISSLASELQRRLPAELYDEPGRIADSTQSPPLVSSPPSVISTSMLESVLAGRDGGVTTTRTTTTTTTTTYTYTQQPGFSAPLSAFSPPKTRPDPLPESGLNQVAPDLTCQTGVKEAMKPYEVSPLSPSSLPFLDSRPAPASTDFGIETHASHYTLKTKLPGFSLDGITLATKHHCQLVIVADKWDESNGGHFERRITFGADADLKATSASFDGNLLKITVPRRRT